MIRRAADAPGARAGRDPSRPCRRCRPRHPRASLCLLLLCLLLPWRAGAQSLLQQDFSAPGGAPWTLEADSIETLHREQVFEAFGGVVIRQGRNSIAADRVTYFRQSGLARLTGNVRIEWDDDILTGEIAEFDLGRSVGWVEEGEIFLSREHFYIRGRQLEKRCENTYAFMDARLTACDGAAPPWSVKSSEGDVTTGGYARLWHPRFQIRDTPVVYFPYMIFPVKTERQSGFLIPEPSFSTRLGAGLNIPYYWVIDEEQDATFYANMMSKRGVMVGIEYRRASTLDSKGVWRADWLHDLETAPTEAQENSQFQGDGLVRPNANRYWLRGKYDGFLGDPLWRVKVDLDLVSDQNYLREFKSGVSGYERTHQQMRGYFGRGLERVDSLIRKNAVELSRSWARAGFRGSLQYDQHLAYWTDNLPRRADPTLQRLPELNLDLFRTRLGPTPLELESRNQAVYFWREFGTTGTRVDFFPKVILPWNTAFGTVTPSIAWRQTFYAVDRHENSPAGVEESRDFFERGLPVFRVDAFTSLFKIHDLGARRTGTPTEEDVGRGKWTRLRHTVQPELSYVFIPEKDQSMNPRFTGEDRIGKRSRLSYGLRNIFNRRLDRVVLEAAGPADGNGVPDGGEEGGFLLAIRSEYRDFLRLRLDQEYDFLEAGRDTDLSRYPRRPFTDVRLEVVFQPGELISLVNRTWYSPYMNRVTEHEHMLRVGRSGVGRVYFGLDFRAEVDDIWRKNQTKREILRLGGLLHLPRGWHASVDYKADLHTKEDLEKIFGLGYTHQCYAIEFMVSQTPDEDRYEVRFSLKGLGDTF